MDYANMTYEEIVEDLEAKRAAGNPVDAKTARQIERDYWAREDEDARADSQFEDARAEIENMEFYTHIELEFNAWALSDEGRAEEQARRKADAEYQAKQEAEQYAELAAEELALQAFWARRLDEAEAMSAEEYEAHYAQANAEFHAKLRDQYNATSTKLITREQSHEEFCARKGFVSIDAWVEWESRPEQQAAHQAAEEAERVANEQSWTAFLADQLKIWEAEQALIGYPTDSGLTEL